MQPTVLLWDIDGTLLTTASAGRHALERAFGRLYGRADAVAAIRFDGMTDRSITRLGLEAIGAPVTDEAIDTLLRSYVEELKIGLARATADTYRVLQGVEAALKAARERGVAQGLGTGNIAEGARLKLERVGLYEHFEFGGFGSDHELRVELVRIGAQRGARHLGVAVEACRVVVIGDTPKDVAAAQGIGAESIGVATGSYSVDTLLQHGATHAFADLTSPRALSALLGI